MHQLTVANRNERHLVSPMTAPEPRLGSSRRNDVSAPASS